MGAISFKLPEESLETSHRCADTLHPDRVAYIRRAIDLINRRMQAMARAKRLADASKKVSKESLRINREFAALV